MYYRIVYHESDSEIDFIPVEPFSLEETERPVSDTDTDEDYIPSTADNTTESKDYTPCTSDWEKYSCGDIEEDIEEDIVEEVYTKEAAETLDRIVDYMRSREPSLLKLLGSKLPLEKMAECMEYFEGYKMAETYTPEWYSFRALFRNTMEQTDLDEKEHELITLLKKGSEPQGMLKKILNMDITQEARQVAYDMYTQSTAGDDDHAPKARQWLQVFTRIPFGVRKTAHEDAVRFTKQLLDKDLYGLDHVKENILIAISQALNGKSGSKCIGLIGPPGVGKTSIVRTISKSTGLPFRQISGHALKHPEGIHGHDYTFVGSKPGIIVESLIQMGSMNGIIFIDEMEKIFTDGNKNVDSILQLLDDNNVPFIDRYMSSSIPIDLSGIVFIVGMNAIPSIKAIEDRIRPIHIKGYSDTEKLSIIKFHVLPKYDVPFTDESIQYMSQKLPGKGVRKLKNAIIGIIEKVQFHRTYPDLVSIPAPDCITLDTIRKFYKPTELETVHQYMYC